MIVDTVPGEVTIDEMKSDQGVYSSRVSPICRHLLTFPDYVVSSAFFQPNSFPHHRIYALIQIARFRLVRNSEKSKWDTSEDRVDHMEAGDYRRVWGILKWRPLDVMEQTSREDIMEATTLPYAMFVDDNTPVLFDASVDPDSDRCILMEQLASLMAKRLPGMATKPRGKKEVEGEAAAEDGEHSQEEGEETGDEEEEEE